MRIAFFTDVYQPTINGVVVSIDSFAKALRARGHEVTIICPTYPDVSEDSDHVLRVGAVTFPTYKEYRIASPISAKIERHMRENAYALIHIHSPFSIGLAGIFYAKRFRLPIVYTAHTNYADYRHYVRGGSLVPESVIDKLAAHFSNSIDLTIAPSKKIADSLVRYGTKKEIAILPTGIPAMAAGSRARFKKKYGNERALTLLYMGRVTKEKNLEFLLEAFSLAIPRLPSSTKLVIAGDGPYSNEIKTLAKRLDVDDQVIFTGFLSGSDRADAYSAGDIFCHVSYSETQGLTLMEAASYGMPLLVSDDSAYAGVAIPDVNAVVVGNDVQNYADELAKLANDKELRAKLGAGSKELAKSFSIDAQTDELVTLYENAIAHKRVSVIEQTSGRR
jgi:1,2-diacylglycerol 3-alpha-glucosyltransferase